MTTHQRLDVARRVIAAQAYRTDVPSIAATSFLAGLFCGVGVVSGALAIAHALGAR